MDRLASCLTRQFKAKPNSTSPQVDLDTRAIVLRYQLGLSLYWLAQPETVSTSAYWLRYIFPHLLISLQYRKASFEVFLFLFQSVLFFLLSALAAYVYLPILDEITFVDWNFNNNRRSNFNHSGIIF